MTMTSAQRIDELLALSEQKLARLEASVSRLERLMDRHAQALEELEERTSDCEEIFAEIKLERLDEDRLDRVLADAKKRTERIEEGA